MSDLAEDNRLISHSNVEKDISQLIAEKTKRILEEGDQPEITAQKKIELLEQLSQFDLGRFLLKNKGLNGYWTHYILTYPWQTQLSDLTPLEKFMVKEAPAALATQERFKIFLSENQKNVENGKRLATIPCGLMGELLYLDFSNITDINLVGIDYDSLTFNGAKKLAEERNLTRFTSFIQADAWNLNIGNEFDLISSNGLAVYEPNHEKVTELYQQFYNALKPNGKLVTSFITPPPHYSDSCEWNIDKINPQDLLLQKIIFSDIIGAKWQCFRSTQQTKEQLESVGFKDIHFIPDKANLFPTVVAVK